MKKLTLALDALEVESFEAVTSDGLRRTVAGYAQTEWDCETVEYMCHSQDLSACGSCVDTCQYSCGGTCGTVRTCGDTCDPVICPPE